jgi:hypothetical protein
MTPMMKYVNCFRSKSANLHAHTWDDRVLPRCEIIVCEARKQQNNKKIWKKHSHHDHTQSHEMKYEKYMIRIVIDVWISDNIVSQCYHLSRNLKLALILPSFEFLLNKNGNTRCKCVLSVLVLCCLSSQTIKN